MTKKKIVAGTVILVLLTLIISTRPRRPTDDRYVGTFKVYGVAFVFNHGGTGMERWGKDSVDPFTWEPDGDHIVIVYRDHPRFTDQLWDAASRLLKGSPVKAYIALVEPPHGRITGELMRNGEIMSIGCDGSNPSQDVLDEEGHV